MEALDNIPIIPKTGNESFTIQNNPLNFKLADFWSWSQSDLLNNTLRGVLAEFIVKQALNIKSDSRTEWDAYDLKTDNGLKIEIKSASFIQSWRQNSFSKISFGIAPTKGWNPETNQISKLSKRQSDLYIFCLLSHKNQNTINPLNMDQWTFYALKTEVLNDKIPKQKTISLNALLKLCPIECSFTDLKEKIKTYNNG